jgi:hypothetical protein
MVEYYPTLIEAAIEFQIYSRQQLCKFKKKPYKPQESHFTCLHSKKYRLQQFEDVVYCLKLGQTVEERI